LIDFLDRFIDQTGFSENSRFIHTDVKTADQLIVIELDQVFLDIANYDFEFHKVRPNSPLYSAGFVPRLHPLQIREYTKAVVPKACAVASELYDPGRPGEFRGAASK
jgi:hypothetical protein